MRVSDRSGQICLGVSMPLLSGAAYFFVLPRRHSNDANLHTGGQEANDVAVEQLRHRFLKVHQNDDKTHTKGTLRINDFVLESGITLPRVDADFETWGTLNTRRDNVVVVCHSLNEDTHSGPGDDSPGWWEGIVGPGKAIDTNRYFALTCQALGASTGSTGAHVLARDGEHSSTGVPLITIRDIVRVQVSIVDALHIHEVAMVIGGSLGGMQAWEWPFMAPDRVKHVVSVAAGPLCSKSLQSRNEGIRLSLTRDSANCLLEGDGTANGTHPKEHALEKERIDSLTRAMDHHDIGRGRGGCVAAMSKIGARLTLVAFDSDALCDPNELLLTVNQAREMGISAEYVELASTNGHDAFLLDQGRLSQLMNRHEGGSASCRRRFA